MNDDNHGNNLSEDQPHFCRVQDKAPAFFSSVDTKLVKFSEINARRYSTEDLPEYVCRQVICKCGEEKLQLSIPRIKNGVFKYAFTGSKYTYQPLVVIFCPKCKSYSTVFDQRLHGWDAIIGGASKSDMGQPKIYKKEPSKLYFLLSYYWMNYIERAKSEFSIQNDLENYVDHLDIFMMPGKYSEHHFRFTCATWEGFDYAS